MPQPLETNISITHLVTFHAVRAARAHEQRPPVDCVLPFDGHVLVTRSLKVSFVEATCWAGVGHALAMNCWSCRPWNLKQNAYQHLGNGLSHM